MLTSPVREGGQDGWNRFDGASVAIGHHVRQAHEGRLTADGAWQAICAYNAAMLRPPWDLQRLHGEFDRLCARHIKQHGPPRQPPPEQAKPPTGIVLLPLGAGRCRQGRQVVLTLLTRLAAGLAFLGFKPPRPLRIAYLQADVQLPYLRERLSGIRLSPEHLALARKNLLVSPGTRMILDAANAQQVAQVIAAGIGGRPFDVVALDPLRNLFDPGPNGGTENDNSAMLFFLRERIEVLRQAAGLGAVLLRPDESAYRRTLQVDLRNGPPIGPIELDYQDGQWRERGLLDVRITGQTRGERLDAERHRRHDKPMPCPMPLRHEAPPIRTGEATTATSPSAPESKAKRSGTPPLPADRQKLPWHPPPRHHSRSDQTPTRASSPLVTASIALRKE